MEYCDNELGAGNYLSVIDVTQLSDHLPGSMESVYKADAYKRKTVTTLHELEH
ncbi:hypothetical protein TUM19329_26710 [Legionella antarctica]|uniref:Uncharacterized protein n=2 Tax=Legionella antarctica TaxID=2708020 RepID=A0A6F8T841_9GAMM|nr:hypothetical protein TUM19329_26710 [Legionella antarctica]